MARRHVDRRPGQRLQRGTGQGGGGGGARRSEGRGPGGRGEGELPARPAGPLRRPKATRRSRGLVVTPREQQVADDGKVRLNRFLAMSGVSSRRAADELIANGRVEVNGTIVTELGQRIDPGHDEVRVDGRRVQQEKKIYILFNKPAGVVCTNARHEQKKRVIDLLPEVRGRIYTVGRLDLDSEGLLLLTNDGDFALQMTHPRYGVPKVYAVEVRGRVEKEDLEKARGGVWLSEGPTAGMKIRVEHQGPGKTFLRVMLREGKNREIRRVFAKLGYPVKSLKRVRIGDLTLHGLGTANWRYLTPTEVKDLIEISKRETDTKGMVEGD
ncbi:MAG: hypothetical protein RIT25_1313 [Planctomycetota bacterium]